MIIDKEELIIVVVVFLAVMMIVLSINSINISDSIEDSVIIVEIDPSTTSDVYVQDQTNRIFDMHVNRKLNSSYSLASSPLINSYNVTLDTVDGLSIGDKMRFLEQNGMPQIYFSMVSSIDGNVVTFIDPVPFSFTPDNTEVFTFDNQLNVDGGDEVKVFNLYNSFDQPVDIVRIMFKCTDDVEMHDGLFCGVDQLSRGIVFRKLTLDGYYINYFNVRNNAKWSLLSYDVSYTTKGKPPDDTYGYSSRLTFGGQNKHGAVIRLEPGESIELLVQDDLTGISTASLMVEGHFVED